MRSDEKQREAMRINDDEQKSMRINRDQGGSDVPLSIIVTTMTTSTTIPIPIPIPIPISLSKPNPTAAIPAAAIPTDQTTADAADVPGRGRAIEFLLEKLVDGEGDGLTGGDAHDARRDALVEGSGALLLDHVTRDGQDTRQSASVGR